MEVVLIITAACGLLGCFASVSRLDVSRRRHAGRPVGGCIVR